VRQWAYMVGKDSIAVTLEADFRKMPHCIALAEKAIRQDRIECQAPCMVKGYMRRATLEAPLMIDIKVTYLGLLLTLV